MASVGGFESQIMIIVLTIGFIILAIAVIALAVKSSRKEKPVQTSTPVPEELAPPGEAN